MVFYSNMVFKHGSFNMVFYSNMVTFYWDYDDRFKPSTL